AGRLLATPYSAANPAASQGMEGPDGLREGICEGPLAGLGGLCFWDQAETLGMFAAGWSLLSLEHCETRSIQGGASHAEWRVVLERLPGEAACLRSAGIEDCDRILEWRNHPFIVERSTSRARVGADEHRSWFHSSLRSPDHLLLVAEGASGPMGLIRFERKEATDEAVATAYLMPEFTGRGLGPLLIAAGCRMAALRMPGLRRICAHVRKDNPAGHSGFLKAGFVPAQSCESTPTGHSTYVLNL
ncbi:MAG: GNAT family N-acetyltransferase, partial [Terrimicrobiaceae bacterium]|nr:GNAT family N-acetyltransferase [Terrimicrobiaceae bacterium]